MVKATKAKYGNIKTVIDGITFDSKLEAKYYKFLKAKKDITSIELQPRYTLQPSFKKNNKTIRAITYVADFRVTYKSGKVEIVDVKGKLTEVFRIKFKLFEFCYPQLELKLIKSGDF